MTSKYLLALPAALSVMILTWSASAQDSAARDAAIGRCIRQAHLQYPNEEQQIQRATCTRPAWLLPAFSRKLLRRWPTSVDIPWRDTDRCSTRSALPHDGEPSLFES